MKDKPVLTRFHITPAIAISLPRLVEAIAKQGWDIFRVKTSEDSAEICALIQNQTLASFFIFDTGTVYVIVFQADNIEESLTHQYLENPTIQNIIDAVEKLTESQEDFRSKDSLISKNSS